MKKISKKGFTLIELLVVMAIIGVLTAVLVTSLNSARLRSRDSKRKVDIQQIQLALEEYYDDCGFYPVCAGTVSNYPCTITGGNNVCSSTGYSTPINQLQVIPGYLRNISDDPVNTNGAYGYYYARGYKKTGSNSFVGTGLTTDYILATRLEGVTGNVFSGWNNSLLNYLLGN